MSIEFNNNVILRQVVRQGTESDRLAASADAFLRGESVYTTDTKRMFVGTGEVDETTTVVGNKFLGSKNFTGSVTVNGSLVAYNYGTEHGYIGDIVWDTNDNSLVIFDNAADLKYRKIRQTNVDGTTIVETNGVLSVNSSALNVSASINSPDLVYNASKDELRLKTPTALSEITLRDSATTLKMPKTLSFGDNNFTFYTLDDSKTAKTEYRLGLHMLSDNTYAVYIINDENSTGGVKFDNNFVVTDDGVSLSKDIVGIESISSDENSAVIRFDGFSEISADSDGLYARVVKDTKGYYLQYSKLPSGGDTPIEGGSCKITVLTSPIPLCWSGQGNGMIDSRMLFAVNKQVYCARKLLCPVGSVSTSRLPYTSELNNPEKDGGEFFKNVSPKQLVEWNNAFYVLGKNNYGNMLTDAEDYEETDEYSEEAQYKLCFTPMAKNDIAADDLAFNELYEGGKGA